MKFSSADYAKHFLEEKIQNDRTKHTKRDGTVKELSWGPDKEHHTFLQHQAVGKVKRFMHETFEKSGKKADVTGNIWKGIVLLDWVEVVTVRCSAGESIPKIVVKDAELLKANGIDADEMIQFVRAQMTQG